MAEKGKGKSKKPKRTKITAQEKLFCNYYMQCWSYGEAYLKAGYKSQKKYAARNGYRLFSEPRVRAYWEEIVQKADEDMLLTRKELILLAKDIAFFDMKSVQSWVGKIREKADKEGEVYLEGPEIDLFNSNDVNGRAIQSISFSPKNGFEIKCEPRLQALKLLMQIKKMLIETKNQETSENNATHIVIEQTIIDKRT